jgi:hypothetical protein
VDQAIDYGKAVDELLKLLGAIGPMGIFAILVFREVLPYLAKKNGNGTSKYTPLGCQAPAVSAEHKGVLEDIAENIREQTRTWREFREEFQKHVDDDRKTGLWLTQELGDLKAAQAILLDRNGRARPQR